MTRHAHPIDPDVLVATTLGCPYVAGMGGGALGEIAVYLPGRRVSGLRLSDGAPGVRSHVEVHVVGVYGPSVAQIVDQVRAALAPLVPGHLLTVYVDDLADPVTVPPRPARSVSRGEVL